MAYLSIGLIVGMIMGLTGAGGALVAIPLFIGLLNYSLKEATVVSLVTVSLGTAVNLFGQTPRGNLKFILTLVVFGAAANYLTLPLKAWLPDSVIAALLLMMGSYSVWAVWQKKRISAHRTEPGFITVLLGSGLGVLTTLTGLGGGILLVPILMTYYQQSYEEALPSSLMTILLISLVSLSLQFRMVTAILGLTELSLLLMGSLLAYFLLKRLMDKVSQSSIEWFRKLTFTAVAVYAVSVVMIKSL